MEFFRTHIKNIYLFFLGYNFDIYAFQIVFFPLYSGTILTDLFSYNKQSLYSCYSDRTHLSTFTYSMQIQLCQDIC